MMVLSKRRPKLALCITAVLGVGSLESVRAGSEGLATWSPATGALTSVSRRDTRAITGFPPGNANGTLTTVTSCADDGGPGTLRQVVGAAASGDTVDLTQLSCSSITLLSGQIEIAVDDLSIVGPGADLLTIDGNHGAGYQNGRVFNHRGNGTLTIDHLTIANGTVSYTGFSSGYGGCIQSNGSVTLTYSTVTGCSLTVGEIARGGGVFANGAVIVDHGEVSNNTAAALGYYAYVVAGGGIHSGGPLTITYSLIDSNTCEASYDGTDFNGITQAKGGGASNYGTLVTISHSVVSNNLAGCDTTSTSCYQAFAGGVAAQGGLVMESSIVSNNTAEAMSTDRVSGGGLYVGDMPGFDSTISSSTISYNHAGNGGGVLVSVNQANKLEITSSTINNNSASKYGGGIWVAAGALATVNTTISENSVGTLSGGLGGGIVVSGNGFAVPMTMDNSTVTANTSRGPDGGAGIVDKNTYGPSDFQSSIIAGNVNSESNATYDSDLGTTSGEVTGANNLIIAADGVTLPADTLNTDPMLGPLQDNGGPTFTHALLLGSPAIDTGNNTAGLDFDQRGSGYPRVSGVAIDIGAFEFQIAAPDIIFADGFDDISL